jgi:hypothetical protein
MEDSLNARSILLCFRAFFWKTQHTIMALLSSFRLLYYPLKLDLQGH